LEKVGLFWKKPYFFFQRLKLDQLRKSRAFSKKARLFPEKALLFRLKLHTLLGDGGEVGLYITLMKVKSIVQYKMSYMHRKFPLILSEVTIDPWIM
jgi:hypothetical protein